MRTRIAKGIGRPIVSGIVGIVVVLTIGSAVTANADTGTRQGSTNPDQADGPGIITIEQLNMCMWGSLETPDCFPNDVEDPADPDWENAELATAELKRASMVDEITRHIPDVVTVNEGCLGDLRTVAEDIGYELAYQDTGGGTDHEPRLCTADRGIGVNAILAKDITGVGPQGYYEEPGYRSYLCAGVSTAEWSAVQVCTTHLSLKQQGEHQAIECAKLRDEILDPSTGYTLFAGDVNMSLSGENCAPDRYHGLKDLERPDDQDQNPTDGLQHVYYSAGFWRQSCGWAYPVEHTDHKGFLLELGTSSPDDDLGYCWRNVFD